LTESAKSLKVSEQRQRSMISSMLIGSLLKRRNFGLTWQTSPEKWSMPDIHAS
jgi:hypothetical protein